jgi:hypothetical protein
MKRILPILVVLGLSLQGCSSYLYEGKIQAKDSAGRDRQVIIYWTKTGGFFAKPKAGPARLLTECGTPIMFEEQPQGIVFRGTPGQDRVVIGEPALSMPTEVPCGSFIGPKLFLDIAGGPLKLTILCEPVADKSSEESRTYIQAREEPYEFPITSIKKWSLSGKAPEAPAPPVCD